jgi:hypothetical protein
MFRPVAVCSTSVGREVDGSVSRLTHLVGPVAGGQPVAAGRRRRVAGFWRGLGLPCRWSRTPPGRSGCRGLRCRGLHALVAELMSLGRTSDHYVVPWRYTRTRRSRSRAAFVEVDNDRRLVVGRDCRGPANCACVRPAASRARLASADRFDAPSARSMGVTSRRHAHLVDEAGVGGAYVALKPPGSSSESVHRLTQSRPNHA